MLLELTKSFAFSASYSIGERAVGRNFILLITVESLDEGREREFESIVEHELVSKIHTRDFANVDFLKDVPKNDADFLKAFRQLLLPKIASYHPKKFVLERDSRTRTSLTL